MYLCTAARLTQTVTIRELAKLIRNLAAFTEAVLYERHFYRPPERDKIKSLQQNKGNFEAKITLSDLSKKELTWWENNIMTATKSLKKLPIDTTINTDASLNGLGQFVKNLKQEPCGRNNSRHYKSMLFNF